MSGRQLHRLSALRVAKEVAPGHYADGGGLYMQIAGSGARSWVFRFRLGGRMRSVEKSGRQHSVKLRNGGIDEPNPQGCVHEGIS